MQRAPGKTLILVAGIIQIISASFAMLASLVVVAGGALLVGLGIAAGSSGSPDSSAFAEAAGPIGIFLVILIVIVLAFAIMELVFGIIGVKNCGKLEKAGLVKGVGIAIIVIQVLSSCASIGINAFNNIYTAPTPSVDASTFAGSVIPVVLGILYIVGAGQNQKAVQSAQNWQQGYR